ncbi:hypothetical protein LTR59_000735 [Friedmanniomyces endolithicus]|nr:hypothetical protein LTR59_000735 [Friedmanniomyces endolithicus]
MASRECPIPSVGASLSPFIKTRDEVTRIRKDLHSHLQVHTGHHHDGSALASLSLANPAGPPKPQTSTSITGVRKAYINALRAHSASQARYDALKADLASLPESKSSISAVSVISQPSVNDSYVPMLHQREKRRQLQLIDRTYAAVTTTGAESVDGHPDDIVRQQAGDVPTPLSKPPATLSEKPNVEAQILKLKKTVLSVRRTVDALAAGFSDDRAITVPPARSGGEILGLQSALNELTGWMEQRLAVIGDAEVKTQATDVTEVSNGPAASVTVSLDEIVASYHDYLVARQRVIHTVSSTSLICRPASYSVALESGMSTRHQLRSPAKTILPYLDCLTSAKHEELCLFQESSFLRRQIAASDSETQRLLARLADESHLVHPGTKKGRGWTMAAAEARDTTKEVAVQRLQAGEASAGAAAQALQGVRNTPEYLSQMTTRGVSLLKYSELARYLTKSPQTFSTAMWLINAHSYKLEWFSDSDKAPPYAILSHTWSDDELTFQDIQDPAAPEKPTFAKWLTRHCVVFRWYHSARICYALLSDVLVPKGFRVERSKVWTGLDEYDAVCLSLLEHSRWFTRGWTLQELIAPVEICFYDRQWTFITTRQMSKLLFARITGINESMLDWPNQDKHIVGKDHVLEIRHLRRYLENFSIAQRMSWAASRQTSRVEDTAYSLLGLFDTNMPMLYGEGGNAFIRLQEHILRNSTDQTIFAWDHIDPTSSMVRPERRIDRILAEHPAEFKSGRHLVAEGYDPRATKATTFEMNNEGLRITLPMITKDGSDWAILQCSMLDNLVGPLALQLTEFGKGSGRYHIFGGPFDRRLQVVPLEFLADAIPKPVILLRLRPYDRTPSAFHALQDVRFRVNIYNDAWDTKVLRSWPMYPPLDETHFRHQKDKAFAAQTPQDMTISLTVAGNKAGGLKLCTIVPGLGRESMAGRDHPVWNIVFIAGHLMSSSECYTFKPPAIVVITSTQESDLSALCERMADLRETARRSSFSLSASGMIVQASISSIAASPSAASPSYWQVDVRFSIDEYM